MPSALLYLAPFWIVFEVWQLVVAERYLGIARIETGEDPRRLPLGSVKAAFWSMGILGEWLWMLALSVDYLGWVPAACMLAVSVLGYILHLNTGIKWVLVILTFEGAIRIGMLLFISILIWKR